MPSPACPTISLCKDWPTSAKKALLHAIACARIALLSVVSDFENSTLPFARCTGLVTRLEPQLAQRDEELRILRSRVQCIRAPNRPHYPPPERLAILTLRAAAGWTVAETARRFLVTAKTIRDWMRRLDDQGADALVALPTPVNRFPEYVAVIVQKLRAAVPHMGKARIADVLARAGLKLSKSTVGRMLSRALSKSPTPRPSGSRTNQPAGEAQDSDGAKADDGETGKSDRVVVARHVHHTWHVDLSLLPTVSGLWLPWFPFSLPQCWPFCFHLAVILDHFSRSVVAWRLFYRAPTADAMCKLLDAACHAVGRAPKYIVSDQGSQFRAEYRAWCDDRDVVPRFGAIGQNDSVAVLERFFHSLKDEMLRRLLVVPRRFAAMHRQVSAYMFWYNQHRPSRALGGRTPAEVREGGLTASERPRWETRARFPLARGRSTRLARRVEGRLELVVDHVDGRAHLPVVSLRQAA